MSGEPINLYQQGQHYMAVTKNGPFAIFAAYYTGDVTQRLERQRIKGNQQIPGALAPVGVVCPFHRIGIDQDSTIWP